VVCSGRWGGGVAWWLALVVWMVVWHPCVSLLLKNEENRSAELSEAEGNWPLQNWFARSRSRSRSRRRQSTASLLG